jgi:hypothetical protein
MVNILLITLGVVAFVLTPKGKKCQNCKAYVSKHDDQCEYCHYDLPMVK